MGERADGEAEVEDLWQLITSKVHLKGRAGDRAELSAVLEKVVMLSLFCFHFFSYQYIFISLWNSLTHLEVVK